jgi:hypothetical protein
MRTFHVLVEAEADATAATAAAAGSASRFTRRITTSTTRKNSGKIRKLLDFSTLLTLQNIHTYAKMIKNDIFSTFWFSFFFWDLRMCNEKMMSQVKFHCRTFCEFSELRT